MGRFDAKNEISGDFLKEQNCPFFGDKKEQLLVIEKMLKNAKKGLKC